MKSGSNFPWFSFSAKFVARAGLVVFAAAISAYCAEIRLPTPPTVPGTILFLPLSFASQSASVTAIQFDLQYDSSTQSLSATIGDSARNLGKTLYLWDLAPGLRRFLIFGINQDPLVDGTLINLSLNLSATTPVGTYALKFFNALGSGASAQAVTVRAVDGGITVQGTAGSLQPISVQNGASLLAGPVAPGEIVVLSGTGIGPVSPQLAGGSSTSLVLGGTSVLFDGIAAPLLYAAASQVNAIAPYGIQSSASTQVQVTQGGQLVAELVLSVVEAAPAIFTLDGSGMGPGAILNQDHTVNRPSEPAVKGSTITLFATGAGQTVPPGTDGQIAGGTLSKPLLPVSVHIGGLEATVLNTAPALGLVAGVLQVSCTVPLGSPSGHAIPIVLYVGENSSQAGVTLAIQ